MSRIWLLAMTALGGMALAAPAQAEWMRLGDVQIDHQGTHDATYSRFGGPVEKLTFMARGSDISCRGITAHFEHGDARRVYSGRLEQNRPVSADVPGDARRIESVSMSCASTDPRGGEVVVGAEVGRFRAAWEHSKAWAGRMARDVEHDVGYRDRQADNDRGWITIGRENFEGRHAFESAYPGPRGRNIDRIALRPVDNDARCMRVAATFGNGRTRDLDIDRSDVMQRGRLTVIDLPGDERDVRKVDLRCRAVGDRDVTIEILARS